MWLLSLTRKRCQAAFLAGLMVLSIAIAGASMITPAKGDGTRFSFTLQTNQGNLARITSAEIVKENLEDIGVDVKLQIVEWPTFVYENLLGQDFDAIIVGWTGGNEDQKPLFHSEETDYYHLNFCGYNNSRVDELIMASRGEANSTARREMLFEIQEIIADEAPYDFLVYPKMIIALYKGWEGFIANPGDGDVCGWFSISNVTAGHPDGILIEESIAPPRELNPMLSTDSASNDINDPMYPSLLTLDPELRFKGDLAKNWEIGEGYFYFELRDDYFWTDNVTGNTDFGEQVNAEDWLFTWNFLYHANDPDSITLSTRSYLAEWIDEMYSPGGDPYKLNVTVNSTMFPDGYVLGLWDIGGDFMPEHQFNNTWYSTYDTWAELKTGLGISDEDWIAHGGSVGPVDGSDYWWYRWVEDSINNHPQSTAQGALGTEYPVTCGYWKLDRWDQTQDEVHLVRNDDWPRWSEAYDPTIIDKYIYKKGGTQDEITLNLRAGIIDLQDGPNPALVADLQADPNINVQFSNQLAYTYMGFNIRRAPFDDDNVRRALCWAIDKEAIYDAAFYGLGEPGTGPVYNALGEWYNPNVTTYTPPNPDLAEELLDAAGWPRAEEGTDWAQVGLVAGIAAAALIALIVIYTFKLKGEEE